ncbi:MAG: DUF4825 domain-containing protein [Paraclostridium sordellii]
MKKWFLPFVITFLLLVGCKGVSKLSIFNNITDMSEVKYEKISKYKNSYVGDNNAVGNILYNLPGNNYHVGFKLKTDKKPYSITVNYNYSKYHPMDFKYICEKNALVMFSLIPNADEIIFNVSTDSYSHKREDLEKSHTKDLSTIVESEESWKAFLASKHIKKEVAY